MNRRRGRLADRLCPILQTACCLSSLRNLFPDTALAGSRGVLRECRLPLALGRGLLGLDAGEQACVLFEQGLVGVLGVLFGLAQRGLDLVPMSEVVQDDYAAGEMAVAVMNG